MAHFISGRVALAKAVINVVASFVEKTDMQDMQVRLINWQCLHTISLRLQLMLQSKLSGNDQTNFFASHFEWSLPACDVNASDYMYVAETFHAV